MQPCNYSKTATGRCHQFTDGEYCYYHDKVKRKLITPSDERSMMRDLQTVKV